jgi:hypothetical protein
VRQEFLSGHSVHGSDYVRISEDALSLQFLGGFMPKFGEVFQLRRVVKQPALSIKLQKLTSLRGMLVGFLRVVQEFQARGHPNVTAEHLTTFEITRNPNLTKRGNCVIGVQSTKGLADLSPEFRRMCTMDDARIIVQLEAGGIIEIIEGRGSHGLTLSHLSEIVGRKSTYVSDRTLMVRADRAACDISRDLIHELRSPNTTLRIKAITEL